MIDYTALGVWTGVTTGLVALVTWLCDRARDRARMYLETVRCLEAEFSTARMYRNRRIAAEAFRSGILTGATDAIDEIVDFFEGVAYYEEIGAIRARDAWTCFFSYMYRFYHLAHEYIEQTRNDDPTLWQSFGLLYTKLYKIEAKDRKKQIKAKRNRILLPRDIEAKYIDQFIEEEANLRIDE